MLEMINLRLYLECCFLKMPFNKFTSPIIIIIKNDAVINRLITNGKVGMSMVIDFADNQQQYANDSNKIIGIVTVPAKRMVLFEESSDRDTTLFLFLLLASIMYLSISLLIIVCSSFLSLYSQ